MNDLAVDLAKLQQIAEYHIPELAQPHHDAATLLADVLHEDTGLFRTPASGESGLMSPAYAKWLDLYGLVQEIMATTVTRYADTSTGLKNVVKAFEDQDTSGALAIDVAGHMDVYANGDDEGKEQGHGPPPDPIADPPKPNEGPDEDEIYDSKSDG